MTEPAVRPFPWTRLARVPGRDARAFAAVHAWAHETVRLGALADIATTLVGAPVTVRFERIDTAPAPRSGSIAVALARQAPFELRGSALVSVEAALAAQLVSRVLRRPVPAVVDLAVPRSPHLAGAVAAIVATIARRGARGAPLRVVAAGPSEALARGLADVEPDRYVATFTVAIEGEAFVATLTVPRPLAVFTQTPAWDRSALERLGELPLSLPVVAAVAVASVGDVGLLRPGDAFLPGAFRLTRAEDGRLSGPVWLAAPGLEFGLCAQLGEDGRLVLQGQSEPLRWDASDRGGRAAMGDTQADEALITAVGEVPVVVRVEIGAVELSARQWAALGCGAVVALGRRVADPVMLRVGGIDVARGELVEIDGEIGVRILERLGDAP